MKKIYLDYASTTPVNPQVIKAMLPYFDQKFANPASLHSAGQEAKQALDESRQLLADALGAKENEIYFTASATESNNTVIKGVALANQNRGRHIIVSAVEHDCILESAKYLKRQGFKVTKLKVNNLGQINLDELEQAITDETTLVSVIHGNNEIGTINDIGKIGKICREKKIYFHTDASQSFGKVEIDVEKMKIDLLTASSHKMYGPKGVALLYARNDVLISPLLHGGGQEFGLRSSTVNVAGIVGFAKAVELCVKEMTTEAKRLSKLRDKVIKEILKLVPNSYLNGHSKKRLPNNISIRFDYAEGEAILMLLNEEGIAVSTGSACSSKSLQASHVLLACGLKQEQSHGSIRITLGRRTTKKEVDYLLDVLPKIIKKLRQMSPFS